MDHFQVDSPCLRFNKSRGCTTVKTSTIKITSIPMTLLAGVTAGTAVVDWLKGRDVGGNIDRLLANVLVTWISTVVTIVSWFEGEEEERERLDSIGGKVETKVWLWVEEVASENG